MCRLLVATGEFDSGRLLAAACAMGEGKTARHDGPIKVHPNGWGAAWRRRSVPGWSVHRDTRPIFESLSDCGPLGADVDTLAVHVRHATLEKNQGIRFTHPIQRFEGDDSWFLMHNGFLPNVAAELGKPRSEFDSEEYLEFLVPERTDRLDRAAVLERLGRLGSGGSSGNAFLFNRRYFYVVHWSASPRTYPRYFTLHWATDGRALFISSEALPQIVPADRWRELPHSRIFEVERRKPEMQGARYA